MTDPFAAPVAVAATHPSADSFRGRLVIIQAKSIEFNVPKQAGVVGGPTGNKITADVTVVDGKGPVQIFNRKVPQNVWLDGPKFVGVWFNQERIAEKGGLFNPQTGKMVETPILCRLETYKPGQPAGQGNAWGLVDPTEEDKAIATAFLAQQMVAGASAPVAAPQTAVAENPFGKSEAPF